MGSFTEFVAAFELRADVPAEIVTVLAANPARQDLQDGLPKLTVEESSQLDELLELAFVDEVDLAGVSSRLLAHLWQGAFSDFWPAYFPGEPTTSLKDRSGRRFFTTRTYFKAWADPICAVFAPMARYCCPSASIENPTFVGHVRFEGDDRPVLIWHDGSELLRYEDSRQRPSAG